MSDLTIKEIKVIFNSRNRKKQQTEEYKRRTDEIFIYICEELASKIIMNCRVPTADKFRTKLGFNQYDIMIKTEPSILIKIMTLFSKEEILLQHYVLSYKIDIYFPKCKLAIEVDEKGHKDKKKCDENERERAIRKHLDCKLIKINPDRKYYDEYVEVSKIINHINESNEN